MERKEGEVIVSDLATQLILARLDGQDKALDGIRRSSDSTGKAVIELAQRLTVLEAIRAAERLSALESKALLTDNEKIIVRERFVTARDRARFVLTSFTIVFSGAVGAIGHALHWW